jgi:hypothetical protein
MSIRTVYEYTNADKGFYSVERAGFVTVSDMVFRMVADMQNHGFRVVNTRFINDTVDPDITDYTSTWPPSIRVFNMVNKGSGYRVGDRLVLLGGSYDTPFMINVTAVGTAVGEITSYQYNVPATYNSIAGIPQPAYLVHGTLDGQANVDYRAGSFFLTTSVTSTKGGAATANLLARSGNSVPSDERTQTNWDAAWGVNGSGGTKGTRWPTDKIWYWTTTSGDRQGPIGTVKKGQEIFDPSGLSTIPAGTTIVNTGTFNIPVGVVYNGPPWYTYSETTASATWVELSANVTISGNTTLLTRGNGAAFTSNTTTVPSKFAVALEATGMVDPKNDQVGVYANVVSSTTSNTIVQVNGMTTPGQSWKPIIYAGQRVTSAVLPGSVSGYVTVVSANINSTNTEATVVLSSNQSLTGGETLQFKFEETEPWRIGIDVTDKQVVSFYAATPIQIDDKANISYVRDASGAIIDRSGAFGKAPTGASGTPDAGEPTQGFLNRKTRVGTDGNAYPLNYSLTITNRGVFFGCWEGSFSVLQRTSRLTTDNYFNWFLIQRPVDRVTGKTLTTGKSPVFCINSVGYRYWQFIVRETDVLHPSQGDADARRLYANPDTGVIVTSETCPYRVPADAHWKDSFAVINSSNQISLTEDSKYLVSFLHNLTTPRFRYSEELDMLGQTSADVCMASNEISVTAYQESTQRVYKALPANGTYNSGLRIAVLKQII